jgi:hypothetical protein
VVGQHAIQVKQDEDPVVTCNNACAVALLLRMRLRVVALLLPVSVPVPP